MQNTSYQQQAIAGMNGVELIVALYDGMVRFLHRAIEATESGNVQERRIAVKRVLDILMHLQSRLRMDVGGPAKTLSEFYAAVFALCIEGSRLSSADRFRFPRLRSLWQHLLTGSSNRCCRGAWRTMAYHPSQSALSLPFPRSFMA